ncbi:MAG TPA: thiamine diphosphokinase [Gaiellaceae bacterium]
MTDLIGETREPLPVRARAGLRGTVVVFSGGPADLSANLTVPDDATVIAADGGVQRALALGLRVHLLIGDLDSVSPAELARLRRDGTRVEGHPSAKDKSDLELALDAALEFEPRRIVVVGSDGGRLDHLLGSLLVLGLDAYAGVELDALLGAARVFVIRRERRLAGCAGGTLSLFALHGVATGIVTDGLVYPLRGESLSPGSSRGLSNVFVTGEACIRLEGGVLVAVCPALSAAGGEELVGHDG